MPTRPRLPTNVIDGLDDTSAVVLATWDAINVICERAKTIGDVVLLAHLNTLVVNFSKVERYVKAARRGEYAGQQEAKAHLRIA